MPPTGPDVSSFQHPNGEAIDWPAVKGAGHSFAFVKATEGTGYVNPYFATDLAGARSAGLAVGAYLFLDPGDGAAQADHFHSAVAGHTRPGDLPVTLDYETSGVTHEALDAARERLHTYGYATMTYSYGPFVRQHIPADCPRCASDPLWLAAYQSQTPAVPPPWREITFWQYADNAPMPGVPGGVSDCSVYLGAHWPLTAQEDNEMAQWVQDPHSATQWALTAVGKRALSSPSQVRELQNRGLLSRTLINPKDQGYADYAVLLVQIPTV